MLDSLLDFFLAQPRRLVVLGHLLARTGGFLLVPGIIGHAAARGVSVVRGMGAQPQPEALLAEVLPGFLGWFSPESPIGLGLALLLVVAGVVVARTGRTYERLARS